jgi:uncharacterized membrane protein YphA (DoxX/SURF4 family)
LFSAFPRGGPGAGLLILRLSAGVLMVTQGGIYLANFGALTMGGLGIGLLEVASGGALLVGFLTPLAASIVGFATLGLALGWLPAPPSNLFDSKVAVMFGVAVAAAVGFLGPGAYSIDARLFGRREIVIPPAVRSSD